MRRMCSPCCARATSGQAVAEPTIPLMKSRRRIAFAQGLGLRRLRLTMMQLQQGFATGGMGSDYHFAWQQSPGPNVRYGSITDILGIGTYVRFTPKSGHGATAPRTPRQNRLEDKQRKRH